MLNGKAKANARSRKYHLQRHLMKKVKWSDVFLLLTLTLRNLKKSLIYHVKKNELVEGKRELVIKTNSCDECHHSR